MQLMNQVHTNARVVFAGAGPGDPELLTLKACRSLQEAEVVICDRLVSDRILEEYVNKQALVLHTGKQGGNESSWPQSLICELLIEYASQGKKVVRLKGGDVTVFSNILDELACLKAHGISFEIIPGITAASGAAAYAGIPLTARGYAQGIRMLTLHNPESFDDLQWQELAQTEDTLVFYMGSSSVALLAEKLVLHGIDTNNYMAVIEQATTPMQEVFSEPMHEFISHSEKLHFRSPALIIVGKVAALHHSFNWLKTSGQKLEYFRPLTGKSPSEARA
jgi:uroporphyrin-III C-methyltransferase